MSLTEKDISEIRVTWRIPMENPTDSGKAILLNFFEKYPSNLEKFKDFKGRPLDELKDCPRFTAHAGRIIRTFDEAINTLGKDYSETALKNIWSKIAVSHYKRDISKESYNELKESIVEILVAACQMNEEQQVAWGKMLDYVYTIMFQTIDDMNAKQ